MSADLVASSRSDQSGDETEAVPPRRKPDWAVVGARIAGRYVRLVVISSREESRSGAWKPPLPANAHHNDARRGMKDSGGTVSVIAWEEVATAQRIAWRLLAAYPQPAPCRPRRPKRFWAAEAQGCPCSICMLVWHCEAPCSDFKTYMKHGRWEGLHSPYPDHTFNQPRPYRSSGNTGVSRNGPA